MAALLFVIEPPCDILYARTDGKLVWCRGFHPVLDAILRRGPVVTRPKQILGSDVFYGYDGLYMYLYWRNRRAKELTFELRMHLRDYRLFSGFFDVELFGVPTRDRGEYTSPKRMCA